MEKPASAAMVGVEGLELKLQAQFPTPFQPYSSSSKVVCILLRKFVSATIQTT
jgi:hypothetical protein